MTDRTDQQAIAQAGLSILKVVVAEDMEAWKEAAKTEASAALALLESVAAGTHGVYPHEPTMAMGMAGVDGMPLANTFFGPTKNRKCQQLRAAYRAMLTAAKGET